jgi:heme-degrading monooxygenase HmoA
MWRGWAPQATADDYQRHYESEVSGHLRSVDGFRGARLLRLDDGHEVMFTSITFFTSLAAVRGFAGGRLRAGRRGACRPPGTEPVG